METDPVTHSTSCQSEGKHNEPRAENLIDISKVKFIEKQMADPNRSKRGRPLRRSSLIKDRTRESMRPKKCPAVMSYDTGLTKTVWSFQEKAMFFKGLEEFGCENMDSLRTYLPHRNENDIANQIRMWKNFAKADLKKKLVTEKKKAVCATVNAISKLDEWIEHFDELSGKSTTKMFALSNIFLLISEYGKFPPPNECRGVDYRAMYRYIHCMLNGVPYYGVNTVTARLLNESIAYLLFILRENNLVQSLQPHLCNKQSFKRPKIRTYGGPRTIISLKNPSAILNLPNMNPVSIPPHILAKPEDEDDDDDCSDLE